MRKLWAQLLVLSLAAARAQAADEVLLSPDDFLKETFGAAPPSAQVLWLDKAAQAQLTPVFGHAYPQARLRYWRDAGRTAWVVEDIGKEFPITAGFVVEGHRIEKARVLIYRESRGGEIRFPAFLRQFSGTSLEGDHLSANIDGISGATLSVWAMERMARAVLTLDQLAP
jgi:hypothetical protein